LPFQCNLSHPISPLRRQQTRSFVDGQPSLSTPLALPRSVWLMFLPNTSQQRDVRRFSYISTRFDEKFVSGALPAHQRRCEIRTYVLNSGPGWVARAKRPRQVSQDPASQPTTAGAHSGRFRARKASTI
jgi:hypothetical protein